ncbi:acetylglutamate kinase [Ulvibacterium sp.]|uniref:acetylglutamate kinase n=1 Tax=Ulvibacterium sp. TaxID=2665914 RepID=UPI003CC60EBC
MKSKLAIVKIGGNVIENKEELSAFLNLFAKMEGPKILVHGGGKKATQILKKMGITPKMAGGRRITDAESLEVVTMVYGGLTNKTIVAQLQALACNAIGLSGADADAIRAHKRPVKNIDYGFAGDVDDVNTESISNLLISGFVPVFCALTHNGKGQLLNTNADTIASEIAIGMGHGYETTLYYCFEKKGVLSDMADDNSVIKTIDSKTYMELREKDIISEGMLPKLENCFHALQKNVYKVCIGDISMIDSEPDLYTTLTL